MQPKTEPPFQLWDRRFCLFSYNRLHCILNETQYHEGMQMNIIFWAFVVAACIHVVEEYFFPGGFLETVKRFNPRIAPFATVRFTVLINGLFLVLCLVGAIVARQNLIFSLSIAGLLLVNALTHLGGTIKMKRYVPGVVTSLLLYLPLSLYAYYSFGMARQITLAEGAITIIIGALYQAIPMGYLAAAGILKSRRKS